MWQVVLPNSDHALDVLSLLPFLQCKAELHHQEAESVFLPWNLGSLILGTHTLGALSQQVRSLTMLKLPGRERAHRERNSRKAPAVQPPATRISPTWTPVVGASELSESDSSSHLESASSVAE